MTVSFVPGAESSLGVASVSKTTPRAPSGLADLGVDLGIR